MPVNNYLSSDRCNVFCKIDTVTDILNVVEHLLDENMKINVLTIPTDTAISFRIQMNSDHIDFHVFKRVAGGDQVSKTILGAYSFFKRIKTDAITNKNYIQQHLAECNASIGVKSSTSFSGLDYDFLLKIVAHSEGQIFNGIGMLNEQGDLILDSEGFYSVICQ
ncbi:hypothetical protein G3495_03775 [Shewanella baltica]|uniref:hypothetical protein n=2 Tax=Shewanella baltica TaxID=62322 RepID=UPI00217E0531|nr:hypothetical protein [Shewanella baltica]MCS6234258.1 hypothetical protein [Shewanella baltica]MCS6270910.1 hypothetical protein [Shewanella baltica]